MSKLKKSSAEARTKRKGAAGAQTPATPPLESRSDEATIIKQRKHRIRKDQEGKKIARFAASIKLPKPKTDVIPFTTDPGPAEMTPKRLAQLQRNEKVITKGLDTFYEVGLAFADIRNNHLYAPDYDSWDDYLKRRWDWTKQRASQLILAAEGRAALESKVDPSKLPTTERAMRELLKAPAEKRVRIIKLASKQGLPSTTTIIEASAEVLGPVGPKQKAKKEAVITIERALDSLKLVARFLRGIGAAAELGKGDRTKLGKAYAKLHVRITKLGLNS